MVAVWPARLVRHGLIYVWHGTQSGVLGKVFYCNKIVNMTP